MNASSATGTSRLQRTVASVGSSSVASSSGRRAAPGQRSHLGTVRKKRRYTVQEQVGGPGDRKGVRPDARAAIAAARAPALPCTRSREDSGADRLQVRLRAPAAASGGGELRRRVQRGRHLVAAGCGRRGSWPAAARGERGPAGSGAQFGSLASSRARSGRRRPVVRLRCRQGTAPTWPAVRCHLGRAFQQYRLGRDSAARAGRGRPRFLSPLATSSSGPSGA